MKPNNVSNKNKLKCLTILGLFFILLNACDNIQSNSSSREEYLTNLPEDIVIGVVGSSNLNTSFITGVKLALNKVNQHGVLGEKLRPVFYDDKGNIKKGKAIAKKLSRNHKVMSVIGHNCSDVAISTSILYEKSKILFISPGATAPNFIQNNYKHVFRNVPSDFDLIYRLVQYAKTNQLQKLAVIYDINSSFSELANFFMSEAIKNSCQIVLSRSYLPFAIEGIEIINEIKQIKDLDALFIAGEIPSATAFIKQARKLGINQLILASHHMDSMLLFRELDKYSQNIIVPTFFDPVQSNDKIREFVNLFKKETGILPDVHAAAGYDAVLLLANSIEKAGSFVPEEIESFLRMTKNWRGATGNYSLTYNGGITGKSISLKKTINNNFKFIERYLFTEVNTYNVCKDYTLRIPVKQNITTIDPGMVNNQTSIEIVEQLFLGLTDFEPVTNKPVPELALSWTVSSDYQAYTFYLRDDVFWTDGTKVTANDIQWAIIRNLKPETKSPYVYTLYILNNAESFNKGIVKEASQVGVKVVNDYCISFQLSKTAAFFPSMAGLWVFRPLPKHIIQKNPNSWAENANIVSNGSYKIILWEKNILMLLRKNDMYFDHKKVLIPEVRYLVIPHEQLGAEMYTMNEVDILGGNYLNIPFDKIKQFSMNPKYKKQFYEKETHCSSAYAFNTQKFPVNNVLVRKAINASINRERLLQYIIKGNQKNANNFTPQLAEFFSTDKVFDPFNAKKWLAKAGYPNGKDFPELIIAYSFSEPNELIAEGVSECLKYYLNIDVKLRSLEWDQYVEFLHTSEEWHLIRLVWCGDYPDPSNWLNELFHPERSDNIIRWNNPEFNQLIEKIDHTTHYDKRLILFSKAEEILCRKECAIVPIYFQNSNYLVNPRIDGWYHMPIGGQHIRNWALK